MGLSVFLFLASGRESFEAKLLRGNGPPYTVAENVVMNVFLLHLVNKAADRRVFKIESKPSPNIEIVIPLREVEIASFADRRLPIVAKVPLRRSSPGCGSRSSFSSTVKPTNWTSGC